MGDSDMFSQMVDNMIENEPQIKTIIAKHNPDLYIIDDIVGSSALIYSDKPWVLIFSGNSLFSIDDERTPPACSGNTLLRSYAN